MKKTSRNSILFGLLLFLALSVWSIRAEEFVDDDGGQELEDVEDSGELTDPRFLFLTSTSNLLNLNTTAALLALLGAASLLTALGFLIYHVVSSKLMMKGQSYSYGSGGYGGGGGSYGGYGSSGGYGSYGGGSGSYGYARYPDRWCYHPGPPQTLLIYI